MRQHFKDRGGAGGASGRAGCLRSDEMTDIFVEITVIFVEMTVIFVETTVLFVEMTVLFVSISKLGHKRTK